jgi:hypothetical protein
MIKIHRCLLWVATLIALAGCSTLSPQVFSKRVMVERGANGQVDLSQLRPPANLAEALQEAHLLQAKYMTAVQDLSQVQPATNLGLIGLSAFSIYKGVTGANTNDIAAAGVLGSSAFLYGSTMTSKPRQAVFLAGAEALACAIAAVQPYNKEASWIGQEPGPKAGTFLALRQKARNALAELNTQIALSSHLALAQENLLAAGIAPAGCGVSNRPACPVPDSASASATERARIDAACKTSQQSFDQRCAVRPVSTQQLQASSQTRALVDTAKAESTHDQHLLDAADQILTGIELAAGRLWERTLLIQTKVASEVLKTEPQTSSVLGALQGLRGMAGTVSGSNLFLPTATASATGVPHGKPISAAALPGQRSQTDDDRTQLAALGNALSAAQTARAELAGHVALIETRVAAAKRDLSRCEVNATGPTLAVLPDDEEIHLLINATATFYVSGGTGAPQGVVVGIGAAAVGELKRDFDASGRARFSYTAKDASPGDVLRIQFTDGAGVAKHDVKLVVGATAVPAKEIAVADISAEQKEQLGVAPNAKESDIVEAIKRCQLKNSRSDTGKFDPPTQSDAANKACKKPA